MEHAGYPQAGSQSFVQTTTEVKISRPMFFAFLLRSYGSLAIAPRYEPAPGDVMSIDGAGVNIVKTMRIPRAGTALAWRFIVRG